MKEICFVTKSEKIFIEQLLFSECIIRTDCKIKNSKDYKLDYCVRDQPKIAPKIEEIASVTVGTARTEGACISYCRKMTSKPVFIDPSPHYFWGHLNRWKRIITRNQ